MHVPHLSRRARRRASTLLTIAATLAIAVPMSVLASHQFADVPDGGFHNDISKIADAGITSGCGGGNYCPSTNVTRDQMAAFMSRGFGVSGGVDSIVTIFEVASSDVLALNFKTPGTTGGTGYLAITVEGSVLADGAGCPCTAFGQLSVDGVYQSNFNIVTLDTVESPFFFGTASMASIGGTWVVQVPTNTTVALAYEGGTSLVNAVDGEVSFVGSMTAVYTPFNSGGTTTVGTTSSSMQEQLQKILAGN